MIQFNHPNLKVFKQHGFIPQGISGTTQVIGRCPFCGVNKKFFNNPEEKKWDCKICGRSGGYQKFLEQIVDVCREQFDDLVALKLSKNRGISVDTLKIFGVGYNKINGRYIIPVWNDAEDELFNVRIYNMDDGILANSAGCKASMFGLQFAKKNYSTIWLCEGEWDTMTMQEILEGVGLQDSIALGIPGANTFKTDWAGIFNNKIVHVAMDNDYDKVDNRGIFRPGAGKLGAKKINLFLENVAKSLDFIHWPKDYKDGFDVRDLYIMRQCRPMKTMRNLVTLCSEGPPPIFHPDGTEVEEPTKQRLKFEGAGLLPEEVYRGYTKWLELPEVDCIDILFATVIANRFSNDPVWSFLVGSSATAKSELIMSLDGCPEILAISSLTPSTLVSGSGGNSGVDPSLIPKLDGLNLAIKDFTTIMQMFDAARQAILSQFRDAYDGNCAKPYGTGAFRVYKSKFGFISGVTYAIEQMLEGGTALGERFLSFHLHEPKGYMEAKVIMEKIYENTLLKNKSIMREDLKHIAQETLSYNFNTNIGLQGKFKENVFAISYWVSKMRGTVQRDKSYKKEIIGRPHIEGPGRLLSQMMSLSMALASFHRRDQVSEEDFKIIRRTALSSVPTHLEMIIREFWHEEMNSRAHVELKTDDICSILRLPYDASYRYAENLYQLGVLRLRKNKMTTSTWRLDPEMRDVITKAEIYPNIPIKHKSKRS